MGRATQSVNDRRPQGDGYSDPWPEVSVFSHELLNLTYDTIEFVDEI